MCVNMCVVVTAALEGGYLLVADCSPLPQMYVCVNMHVNRCVYVHVCIYKTSLAILLGSSERVCWSVTGVLISEGVMYMLQWSWPEDVSLLERCSHISDVYANTL